MNITNSVYALIGGFLLDLLLGDPHTPWHPACIIGKYICGYEKILRKTLLKTEENKDFISIFPPVLSYCSR